MNIGFNSRWLSTACLFCLLCFTGCVHYGQFRDDRPGDLSRKSIWQAEGDVKYYLGFIEVDDFGEMYDRHQLDHVIQLIQHAKLASPSPSKNAIVITFIHGWKNNSSDQSGNVWGFRDELDEIAKAYPNQSVVGVYIGWRGAVTNLPVVKEFTFFNRRNAAVRIPGAHLTEILDRIMHKTKSCVEHCAETPAPGTGSLCIIIGHSFGGMVLERSLTQSVVGDLLRQENERLEELRKWMDQPKESREAAGSKPPENEIQAPADLIAMVNEAAPATEGRQLLDLLKKHKMKLRLAPSEAEKKEGKQGPEEPLFLSITSESDVATGLAMPLGQYPSLLTKSMRAYKQPVDPPEIPKQSTYYLHTTAHLPPLFSHLIGRETDEKIKKAMEGARPEDVRCYLSKALDQRYCIVPVPNRYNTTPYWVMQMPKEVVPDHSTIFTRRFRELLAQFITHRVSPQGALPTVIQFSPGTEQ